MSMASATLTLSALSSLFWACQNQIPSKTRMQCIYTSVMRRHCFVRHTSNPDWESVNKSTGHFRTMSFHHTFKKCGSLAAKQLNDWNLRNMFNNKLQLLTKTHSNSKTILHKLHVSNPRFPWTKFISSLSSLRYWGQAIVHNEAPEPAGNGSSISHLGKCPKNHPLKGAFCKGCATSFEEGNCK